MEAKEPEVLELDSRQNDKVRIALWWVKGTLDTYVTVTDYENQIEVVVDVPKGELPHAVYQHAMAYLPALPEAA